MRRHFSLRRTADDGRDTLDFAARRGRVERRGGGPGPGGAGAGADRKTMQLCHQVAVTLDEVLAECGDPLLHGLHVVDVEPSPDVSRLLVILAPDELDPVETPEDLHRVETHLARASGHLRGEVAQAITRKRAPALVYHLALGEAGG